MSSKNPGRLLSAAFLEKHKNKNDLVRRLRLVVEALSDDDVNPNDTAEYSGIGSLTAVLVEDRFLNHRDKEVRLHTVLACMELFSIYAPEPPWDERETLKIFEQIIRQLANLAHCTSPTQTNYMHYSRLLEQLAVVKTGVVLVELSRMCDSKSSLYRNKHKNDDQGSDDDDNDNDSSDENGDVTSEEAVEMLADLLRTIMQLVHIDHPTDVANNAVSAVCGCIDEFDGSVVPIPVLDEILSCVSGGPFVNVTNPAFVKAIAERAEAAKKANKKSSKHKANEEKMPPRQIQQTNPSYMVARAVINKSVDRLSTPIANLLNGILNGDTNVTEKTSISSAEVDHEETTSSSKAQFTTTVVTNEKHSTATVSADVWSIIYELHRIAPQILTTVIGTVSNSLQSPNGEKRLRVTKLLGRLFYARGSTIGVQFGPCYREWLGRTNDVHPKIRTSMVKSLVTILSNKGHEKSLTRDASRSLVSVIEYDPNLDVRTEAIHQVCDLAYKAKDGNRKPPASGASNSTNSGSNAWVSPRLLQAVGNRVSSKNKTERRDAVTGLANIYYRHYVLEVLQKIQAGGDDCDIDLILEAIHNTGNSPQLASRGSRKKSRKSLSNDDDGTFTSIDEKYNWIPRRIFESACLDDATDFEMRNRIYQIVDDVIMGTGASDGNTNKGALTQTSRAVGLSFIVDSLQDEDPNTQCKVYSNSYKWMCDMLRSRAKLQTALGAYINIRTKIKGLTQGTEEFLTVEAQAKEQLENVARLTSPVSSSGSSSNEFTVLETFHAAKDKHIFRLLATIADPAHSQAARSRAFEELPKRTKSLGNATATWVRMLARRCAMGNFVNVEIIKHSILLARECFQEDDIDACSVFLRSIEMATAIFPTLCGTKESFGNLIELFGESRSVTSTKKRKEIDACGIVTTLSRILLAAATARRKESPSESIDPDLQSQLLNLCTRDGTPQQAKFAVHTMAALLNPRSTDRSKIARSSFRGEGDVIAKEHKVFDPLLKALTSPTRLSLTSGASSKKDNTKLISVLTALAALAECAPSIFGPGTRSSGRGEKAIKFALETVLLGRTQSDDNDDGEEDDEKSQSGDEEEEPCTPKSGRRQSKANRQSTHVTHESPSNKDNLLEDTALSVACRRACAAIELITSHIRSSVIAATTAQTASKPIPADEKENQGQRTNRKSSNGTPRKSGKSPSQETIEAPSREHIRKVFELLIQILHDNGLPPSNRDRRYTKSRQDRAALRMCTAVHLLRLCDARLKLEKEYLTSNMWHILSGVFLDEERVVREGVMEEFCNMLQGQGYHGRTPPSLRFLALICFCADGEHGAIHSGANGNAAAVGKRALTTKNAALQCIRQLRSFFDIAVAHCRAHGQAAEEKFENRYKMEIMPEFAVPFAMHLLSFRRETPSAGGAATVMPGTAQEQVEDSLTSDEEGRHKVLKKRLKFLFEPLVQSLGDTADNISFLLRMAEMIGNNYYPVNVSQAVDSGKDSSNKMVLLSPALDDEDSCDKNIKDFVSSEKDMTDVSTAKLKIVCSAAREVLLSYVKKDVNLTPYPGALQLPRKLFRKLSSTSGLSQSTEGSSEFSQISSSSGRQLFHDNMVFDRRRSPPMIKGRLSADSADQSSFGSARKVVHFSPEVPLVNSKVPSSDHNDTYGGFGGLSPIQSSKSPSPSQIKSLEASKSGSSEEKTLGTTPPSILRSRDPKSTLSVSPYDSNVDKASGGQNKRDRDEENVVSQQSYDSVSDETSLPSAKKGKHDTKPKRDNGSQAATKPKPCSEKDGESPGDRSAESNSSKKRTRRKMKKNVPKKIATVLMSADDSIGLSELEEDNASYALTEKRKSPGGRSEESGGSKKKKNSSSPVPIRINLAQKTGGAPAQRKDRKRSSATVSASNELDFPDEGDFQQDREVTEIKNEKGVGLRRGRSRKRE